MINTKFGKRSGQAAVIIAGLILNAVSALAGTDIILSGSVSAITTVTIGATAPLGTTLGTVGLTAFTVATATEINNVTAGYTVTVTSASSAAQVTDHSITTLRLTGSLATTPIPYTMTYGGATVSLDPTLGTAVFTRTSTVNTPAGVNEDLDITTSAATSAQAGTYTDTVTLTIASL
jgi:hypothetical protein